MSLLSLTVLVKAYYSCLCVWISVFWTTAVHLGNAASSQWLCARHERPCYTVLRCLPRLTIRLVKRLSLLELACKKLCSTSCPILLFVCCCLWLCHQLCSLTIWCCFEIMWQQKLMGIQADASPEGLTNRLALVIQKLFAMQGFLTAIIVICRKLLPKRQFDLFLRWTECTHENCAKFLQSLVLVRSCVHS